MEGWCILVQIIRGKIESAQRCVIYGPEGIGKSTLASKFPDPLFIDTEGSTKQLDVARTPRPSSWAMLLSQVEYVKNHADICKTLVIDTADWAEDLCKEALCAKHQKAGIEDFGYGKGYVYLGEEFGRLLNLLSDVVERGIHVVFTAHAQMRKFEQPDETGSYDRWELKLEKKTAPLLKEWADMVLFANYRTYVVNVDGQGSEKGKNKAQGGKRVMYTTHHPCWDAKNRHDLPNEIPLEYGAIAHCFAVEGNKQEVRPAEPVEASAPPKIDTPPTAIESPPPLSDKPASYSPVDASKGGSGWTNGEASDSPEGRSTATIGSVVPLPEADQTNSLTKPSDELAAAGVPRALADLMRENDVTLDEIYEVVANRGYFPKDTPFRNYPPDFVEGVLIGAWSQVYDAIVAARVPF